MTSSHTAAPLHVSIHEPEGEVRGPGVLFIHGYASSGEADFGALAERLSGLGRTCAVVDLPAHGTSPDPQSSAEASIEHVVAAIGEAASTLGSGPFNIVGYSLGARLAWEFASRHPNAVERIVLGGFGPGDPFSMVNTQELWAFVNDGTEPADPVTAILGRMAAARGERAVGTARVIEGLGSQKFVPSPDYSPKCPVLLLCGRDDDLASGSEQIARILSQVEFVMIDGDHSSALHSAEFAEHTVSFLV